MNIDYPFHFDDQGRTASTTDDDHIRDMIEQLLFTSPGERVNRPDFGSGLLQMVFAPNSPELAAALQFTLQAALERWLGDVIEVQALEVTSQDATLRVLVQYVVRRTGEVRSESLRTEWCRVSASKPYAGSEDRRRLVRDADLNGLDYLEVSETSSPSSVFFLGKAPESFRKRESSGSTGGSASRRCRSFEVKVHREEDPGLDDRAEVVVDQPGDFSTYTLRAVEADERGRPTRDAPTGLRSPLRRSGLHLQGRVPVQPRLRHRAGLPTGRATGAGDQLSRQGLCAPSAS